MATGLGEAMELMMDASGESADACTLLVAFTPGNTNTFSLYHARLWHDFVAIRVLQRFHVLASPPPVFRNWLDLGAESGARRRQVLMSLIMRDNKKGMANGVVVLYKKMLYNVCNKGLPGVSTSMMQPNGPAPEAANAQGKPYYLFRRTHMVSSDGLPYDGLPKRRVQTCEMLCLFVMARALLDAFTNTWRHPWGVHVLVAFADALRTMVVDESFDWNARLSAADPPDPGAWHLFLPTRRQRAACDIEVQTMSEVDLQQWDDM